MNCSSGAKRRKDKMFVEIDDNIQNKVAAILAAYSALGRYRQGTFSGADPFVIALAVTRKPTMMVVTEEQPGKTKKFQTFALRRELSGAGLLI